MGYATAVSISVTMFTLALLSIDQWIIVHRSLTYHLHMTRRRSLAVNVALWALSFFLYTPYFTDAFHFR